MLATRCNAKRVCDALSLKMGRVERQVIVSNQDPQRGENLAGQGQLPPEREAAPKPGIWACPNCGARIQVIIDPDHTWDQPFTCVCGTRMETEQVDENALATESECAHCGTLISYEESTVQDGHLRFCCQNCANASTRPQPVTPTDRQRSAGQ